LRKKIGIKTELLVPKNWK